MLVIEKSGILGAQQERYKWKTKAMDDPEQRLNILKRAIFCVQEHIEITNYKIYGNSKIMSFYFIKIDLWHVLKENI